MANMEMITGGVTAAKGFEAAGCEAGVKYENRKDMALVYSQSPCTVAGVFTSNVAKAAPVRWDKNVVTNSPYAQAVIVNTGIANAGTGTAGYNCCRQTAQCVAETLDIPLDSVLVASTGVIGMQVPMDKITEGIRKLAGLKAEGVQAGTTAAEAILTTDTMSKEAAVQLEIGGKTVTVGGMCKGSGMIHPNMSTMLGFVTTDLAISKELLQEALSTDVQDTFNMVSVDGDTSTNDTLLVLANGMAGNETIINKDDNYYKFLEALHYVDETLAKKMAGDGEGATALVETKVIHAANKDDAKRLSKAVICSNLTKAAIFGHDANWGRVLCALGNSGVVFEPEKIDIFFEGGEKRIQLCRDGVAVDFNEEEATKILSEPEVRVLVDMKMGDAQACAWGCDLSFDYVKINADYRS